MLTLFYAGSQAQWPAYAAAIPEALAQAGIRATLTQNIDPALVDYVIFAPDGPISDFAPFTRAKAVLSLWAGVERIIGNATLTQPLCRMVDQGLSEGMVEYVVGHAMRHHLGLDLHIANHAGRWDLAAPPLARDRKVAVLGLGALGSAVARALAALNFDVHGWSRSAKTSAEVGAQMACHHGADGLERALRGAQIVVTVLPNTPHTENTLNAQTLGLLAMGAHVINPGRGALIDDAALLAALETGRVGHATLDVFRTEPLPPAHPYWAARNVTVTPHIAAQTRPRTAAQVIAQNIARIEAGTPPLYLVDRAQGY